MTSTPAIAASNLSQRAQRSADQAIGRLMAQALAHPDLISLAAGFVDNATLPVAATQAALAELSADEATLRKSLQYDSSAGSASLRAVLAEWAYRKWDYRPNIDNVILTAGSNQLLHLLAETVFDPGDIVIAAAPTYFVYMGTLNAAGVRVVGVEADDDGIQVSRIAEQLERIEHAGEAERVKAVYVVTDFDNPAGSCLSRQRRGELVELLERWNSRHARCLLISDCAYTELRYSGEDIPPILDDHPNASDFVVEAGTFSKSFSPGIRVGWGVVPDDLVAPMLGLKSGIDFGSPHFSQALVQRAIESGKVDAHLPVIREAYSRKLQATLAALEKHFGNVESAHWRSPEGGLYVWVTLPEHLNASEGGPLWRAAIDAGVLYVPGDFCYPSEGAPTQRNTIRLSFGVANETGIEQGIERLASAVRLVASS